MNQLKIANSIRDVPVGPEARDVADLMKILKDLDAQRIAKRDDIVIRKAVLGLLAVVGRLEARIAVLEQVMSTADAKREGRTNS